MRDRVIVAILVFVVLGIIFGVLRFSNLARAPDIAVEPKKQVFKPAPDFTLLDIDGNEMTLSDFKGKVVILDFWATWCPPCKALIPNFIELYDEYKDEGLEILGVTMDWNAERVAGPFAEENGINYIILLGDRDVSDLYGDIMSLPTIFIIDREGGIRKKYMGYRDKGVFERDIKELL